MEKFVGENNFSIEMNGSFISIILDEFDEKYNFMIINKDQIKYDSLEMGDKKLRGSDIDVNQIPYEIKSFINDISDRDLINR